MFNVVYTLLIASLVVVALLSSFLLLNLVVMSHVVGKIRMGEDEE